MKETTKWMEQIGKLCFYLGLFLEVLIVILDKSEIRNGLEGQMFRITFLLFCVKICLTKYSRREWAAVLAAGVVAAACYLCSTRDEAVRAAVFLASMKGIDHKKAMKFVFWMMVTGMSVLAVLSLSGMLGTVYEVTQGYGIKENTLRLCLGLGNSNAFACMIWTLMTLGIYLYHKKFRLWHYILLAAFSYLVYRATLCRTVFLIMAMTVTAAVVMQYCKKVQQKKWVYLGGIFVFLAGIAFSVYAASVSDWYEFMPPRVVKLDRILTGRIASICDFTNGGGVLENWRLFGKPNYVEYFDMGYVRLFWWYGIIPGICVVAVLCLLIWHCRTCNDYMGFVLVMSFAVYTVIEAHVVSVYLARNYVLLLLGAYWMDMLWPGGKKAPQKEAYWWRFWTLFGR